MAKDRFDFLARIFLEGGTFTIEDLSQFLRTVWPGDPLTQKLYAEALARERERDEARRHAEAFRYSWAVEVGVGRKRVKREEPFPWEEK